MSPDAERTRQDLIEQWEDIHGDRQCDICGYWLEVTGTPDRPCECGLVKDDYARTDRMVVKLYELIPGLGFWPLDDLVAARHNLTRLAEVATQVAESIGCRIADMEQP